MEKWLTVEDVVAMYTILNRNTQAKARHYRQITYTKCGRRVVYKLEWIEEYLMRKMIKAKS